MKYLAFFFLISLMCSCEEQELALMEQFFDPDEILNIAEFQRDLEYIICKDGLDANFTCYNSYFNQVYDPHQKRYNGTHLNSHAFVEEIDPATFDLLFRYYAGQEKKSYDSSKVGC